MVSARERVLAKHDDDVVIVSAVRTAMTKVGTSLNFEFPL
jgi:hypothetical protein